MRPPPEDRPKGKQAIPGCAPWLLIRTKLGRRFVHNPELNESFWKFPPEVLRHVVELDRKERERRERRERGEPSESEEEVKDPKAGQIKKGDYDSDEYEEVEVTDDEGETPANKKRRLDEEQPAGPLEFDEDDIAYQLAALEHGNNENGGQEGEFDDDGFEEEPPHSEEDSRALFRDLLDDFHINPYTPWEKIIEAGTIVDDSRYTCLSNMKARHDCFDEWSHDKIQLLKEQREKQEKKDPKIAYFSFLEQKATPKLYWPEFRRKFKKEPEIRDAKLPDKDKEKYYRELINRLKLPLSTLKADLKKLLEAQPLTALHRSTTLETLPPSILTDLRYISLRALDRDPLIKAYIDLQARPVDDEDIAPEDTAVTAKARQQRERRELALKERERKVEEEKKRRIGKERASKGMLREGEEEVQRAMRIGRGGLLGQFQDQGPQTELEIDMAE